MLTLPDAVWQSLLDRLTDGPPGLERVAYLDGFRLADGTGVATTVTVPHTDQGPGHFTVSADEMSRAGAHLRRHGLVRLAQVHTHPGDDVRHSPTDDACAYSLKEGALSIVLPRHARARPGPLDGAVHLRQSGVWLRLASDDAADGVRLVPSLVDTRRCATVPTVRAERRWHTWPALWAIVTRRR